VDSSYTAHTFDEKNYIAVAAYLESLQDFTFLFGNGVVAFGMWEIAELF
jgi:uncharacterized membrane protein